MTHSDDESRFEATIGDLAGPNRRELFTRASQQPPWWRWRGFLALLLVSAALVAGAIVSASRQPSSPEIAQATPVPSLTASPIPISPAVWAALAARPLQFPAVASLAACPVSLGRHIDPSYGLAAGTGPLYIVRVEADGTVAYLPAPAWGDHVGWGGMIETLWIFRGTFSGPVLVRGQRLDAGGDIRFNTSYGKSLESALQITVQTQPYMPYQEVGGWYVRFNTPGCYGLQVDWLQGTELIIFRAQQEQGAG